MSAAVTFIPQLFGPKELAFLDVWSIEHILSGASVGYLILGKNPRLFGKMVMSNGMLGYFLEKDKAIRNSREVLLINMICLLCVGFAWESVEHYLETGLAGQWVQHWLHGVEHWSNRIISDNLMLLIGFYYARKHQAVVLPARILSALWLFVHLVLFPHSMYLHDLLPH